MKVIRLEDKFAQFTDHWNPRVIGELNDQHLKIARVQGEFIWHNHAAEDELFMVVKGQLLIDFRDGITAELNPGELLVVPRGTDHRPHSAAETWILMIEPKSTVNTGDQTASERTRTDLEQI
ncbi:cupin domain-containing protein [Hymenobacter lapidiphilus]|uniref:Cupin domain-containing protein n=1 Tax=Hymenobacter lapidiphilus TaxID=2608003 RepID=A0A7Y7PNT7_9BACT|nr:cupin domain-containing protein [Hymenobacter lapidiphilus]NVO31159.1 cupin domain-containing protein [Hymenobacter lapidiphilus]